MAPDRHREGPRHTRLARADDHLLVARLAPAVDVYLPVCGEDVEVLDNTFRHVARLDWPGVVEVWVLDDGADPRVADLAERHGFRYRVRPDRGTSRRPGTCGRPMR